MENDRIVIIGAGFAGLGLAVRLKEAGIEDFTILEQADEVGGTWRDNHYPGAACDVQSHLYSFSFEKNPNWSREFAPQEEIQDYLVGCADKYEIRKHIQFGTEVEASSFDEDTNMWEIRTNRGVERCRVVVAATGGLSRPAYPDIEGWQSFEGRAFHSSRWDHSYDFAGKKVAVIGTGASAIQIVPEVAKECATLTVFQRTAPWLLPKPDGPISEAKRAWFAKVPFLQALARLGLYWTNEWRMLAFVDRPDLMQKYGEPMARKHLAACVADPELREKLTPDYRMGCKRILMSNEYYQTVAQDHVDLVTDPIERIVADGLITKDGSQHEFDAIIFATGFQIGIEGAPFQCHGRGGVELTAHWQENGVEAYRGSTVPHFPNAFLLSGPNTGLSHTSMVYMLESVMNYIVGAVRTMHERRLARVEVRQEACTAYNRELQARFDGTVWSSGCKSWYLDKNGKNVTIWPGHTYEFRRLTKKFDADAYVMIEKSAADAGDADRKSSGVIAVPASSRTAA